LAKFVGVEEKRILTFKEFREMFEARKKQQMKMNKLSRHTFQNYQRTLDLFEKFLGSRGLSQLQVIDETTVHEFSVWRIDRVSKPQSTGGAPSLDFDLRHLHHAFEIARELRFIENNPWPSPPRTCQHPISTPYSAYEVVKWEQAALFGVEAPRQLFPVYDEWLPFWLLRWTGFRPRDAVDLQWKEVLLEEGVIVHVCHKNHKKVPIPILANEQLIVALQSERKRRNPRPNETVLINPRTGNALTVHQLWVVMLELGNRAGIAGVHPYRSRGTFAVEMLLRTNNPYYVAKLLGDTVDVVVRHYMPYVRELQERTRFLMESQPGLRQFATALSQSDPRSVINIRKKSA
jgi:site-specific recombinase XerD